MVNSSSNPAVLELEPTQFNQVVADLGRQRKGVPPKYSLVRVRLTSTAVVIEATSVDARGRRVQRQFRLAKQKAATPRGVYKSSREQFEAAAAKHRVPPSTLAERRHKNAKAISAYWKQPPVE